jgi:hypothetical protein
MEMDKKEKLRMELLSCWKRGNEWRLEFGRLLIEYHELVDSGWVEFLSANFDGLHRQTAWRWMRQASEAYKIPLEQQSESDVTEDDFAVAIEDAIDESRAKVEEAQANQSNAGEEPETDSPSGPNPSQVSGVANQSTPGANKEPNTYNPYKRTDDTTPRKAPFRPIIKNVSDADRDHFNGPVQKLHSAQVQVILRAALDECLALIPRKSATKTMTPAPEPETTPETLQAARSNPSRPGSPLTQAWEKENNVTVDAVVPASVAAEQPVSRGAELKSMERKAPATPEQPTTPVRRRPGRPRKVANPATTIDNLVAVEAQKPLEEVLV